LSIIKEKWDKLNKNMLYNIIKNQKVDLEHRIFQEKWIVFLWMENLLICSKGIAVLKEYNTAGHYNSKHKQQYRNCTAIKEGK
jgi:hypothetical protein